MTLTSIKTELRRAREEGYAVLLTNVADIPSAEGFFAALEEWQGSGILGVYGGTFAQPNAGALAVYLRTRAAEVRAPLSLMLDHGSSFEQCRQAVAWGFTDVMIDGSRLPFQENIDLARKVVEFAHAQGVGVEAELGHVGDGRTYNEYGARRLGFTDPNLAEQFVAESGVDILAVAIGTAHGVYTGEPHLDLDLLAEIAAQVDIPLALHGGTGLTDEQFRAAIAGGIAKINVATGMFIAAGQAVAATAQTGEHGYFRLIQSAQQAFQEQCRHYLELFGKRN